MVADLNPVSVLLCVKSEEEPLFLVALFYDLINRLDIIAKL